MAKRRTEGKWFGARYGRTEEKERGGSVLFSKATITSNAIS